MPKKKTKPLKVDTSGWMDWKQLLDTIFTPQSRPSQRWLWKMMKQRVISYYKVGRRVWFDPEQVKRELQKKNIIRSV